MKCSLGISNFLEELSSLSHSIIFLYFFALITEKGFLISPCYPLELCIQMGISFLFFHFFPFILISWRPITLQYYSAFCHTLAWISHGFTCAPHPDPPYHLPPHLIPLGLPSASALSTVSCIQPGLVICFTLDNKHISMLFSQNIPPSPSPTESKSLFCTSVSPFLFCI